jgi:hypothetical protein
LTNLVNVGKYLVKKFSVSISASYESPINGGIEDIIPLSLAAAALSF